MYLYFELVEKILSKYPLDWQKNYFKNKKDLIVKHEEKKIKSITADYNHEDNIITIYGNNNNSIAHELFHMSFRDKEKVGKKIDDNTIYGNGVCFKYIIKDRKHLNGLTEGFAEYLTRLCQFSKGHVIEYFFTDLLISIYGEEILEYSFLNNPLGLLMDNRFYNIIGFAQNLDDYHLSIQEIEIIIYMRKNLEEVMDKSKVARKEIIECMEQTLNRFNKSLPNLFDIIIEEYFSCDNSKIEKDLFVSKLSSFMLNPDYAPILVLDKNCYVKRKIQNSIDLIK